MKNRIVAGVMAFVVAGLSASAGFDGLAITAKAYDDETFDYPINDLEQIPLPEVEIGDTVVVDEYMPAVLNGGDLNYDVDTGKHYNYLSDEAKAMYRAIVKASTDVFTYEYEDDEKSKEITRYRKGVIPIFMNEDAKYKPDSMDFQDAYEAARYDHPELVQLTMAKIHFKAYPIEYPKLGIKKYDNCLYLVSSESAYTQQTFDQMSQQVVDKRNELLSGAGLPTAGGALEKELAIHDYLIDHITYDTACSKQNTAYHLGHTVYGALINNLCVCDGYAMAFEYLLDGVGINSYVLSGVAGYTNMGGHAWSVVEMGDDWYEVDLTWDDTDVKEQRPEEYIRQVRHFYYNLTTAGIQNFSRKISGDGYSYSKYTKRSRDGFSTLIPTAHGTTYNYENVLAAISGAEDITVTPVTEITVLPSLITDAIGSVGTFTADIEPENATNTELIWKSSNDQVITVDQAGNYSITGPGYATVTVTSSDGKASATIIASISDAEGNISVGGLSISTEKIEGKVGDSGTISFNFKPSDATNKEFSFICADDDIITITKTEEATVEYKLVKCGETCIVFSTEDGGYEAYCYVKVSEDESTAPQQEEEQEQEQQEPGKNADVPKSDDNVIQQEETQPLPEVVSFVTDQTEYKVDASGSVCLNGVSNKKIKKFTVPKTVEYDGKTYEVTTIGKNAGRKLKNLTKLTIGSNIVKIENGAFSNCTNLDTVTIYADNLKSIGNGFLKKIKKGTKIVIVCRTKKTYNRIIKKLKKAGVKDASFKFKKLKK
jgi:uncharacterized protein YjdB